MYSTATLAHSGQQAGRPESSRGGARSAQSRFESDGNVIRLPRLTAAEPPPVLAERQPTVQLHVLGGFRLLVDGDLVNVGTTGQRLLAVVACRGRQATRAQVAHALWPDTTSERALANLRTALYRMFRSGPRVLHATNRHIQLNVGIQIDVEQTTKLANRILGSDVLRDETLVEDVLSANLYDDLLPDWDEEWLSDYQGRYRQLRLTALEALSGHLSTIGHHGGSVQAALAAVQADSLRDSAHETLIRAYLAQGNRREAFAHYSTYRRLLRDELGVDPPASIGRLLTSA
jgi:DNA-binding SARP family transcriptional activator